MLTKNVESFKMQRDKSKGGGQRNREVIEKLDW